MHHSVSTFAFLLRQRNDERVVSASICPVSRTDIPVVVHLIRDIELEIFHFETLVLNSVIGLGKHVEPVGDRQFEHATIVSRIRDRGQSRRRKTRIDVLHVKRNLTGLDWQEITESDIDICSICSRIGTRKGRVVVTVEFEATVI